MKFDAAWLTEMLEQAPAPEELAERLTACGFNVETREPSGGSEVWDVEVTTNRPDAMNHRGLAREAAVATGACLRPLVTELVESEERVDDLVEVAVEAPELCSRYVARVVRGVRVGPSPPWLAQRLERCGVRPINAVVDATNYVLLELGQPLHAFDLAHVAGRRIVVRTARPGERLRTLDGEERALAPTMLVIADAERAQALAGIMGGAATEIGDGTSDVLIESAHFAAVGVRRTARALGMHTEASHRFERGADPILAATACDAAAGLIARLTGGRVCRGRVDVWPRLPERRELQLSLARLRAFIGLEVAADRVLEILDGLELRPAPAGDGIGCTVPSFRVDLERVADLYEEILRHVGFDAVPAVLPSLATVPGERRGSWPLVDRARTAAVAAGLAEVVTYAFIAAEDDEAAATHPLVRGAAVTLANPLARTQSTMRRSLLPGVLGAARDNLNQGTGDLALFEQGRAYELVDDRPVERERLAIVLAGRTGGWDDARAVDFAALKGVLESVLPRLPFAPVSWRRGGEPWLDPTAGAVLVDGDGRTVGLAGRVARASAERFGLRQEVWAAELELDAVLAEVPAPRYEALPRFPAVAADVTVEHPRELTLDELLEAARASSAGELERLELVARFSGEGLTPGTVRTTLRAVYRHSERSLTQDEVNQAQERLRQGLVERLGVALG